MVVDKSIVVKKVQTEGEIKLYNDIVKKTPNTSFFNNYYWLNSYSEYGVDVSCFIVYENEKPIGGYGQIEYLILGFKFISIPHGPFVLEQSNDQVFSIISHIKSSNKDKSFILLKPYIKKSSISSGLQDYCNEFNLEYNEDYPNSLINYFDILKKFDFNPCDFNEPIKCLEVGQIVLLNDGNELLNSYRSRTSRYIKSTLKEERLYSQEIFDEKTLQDAYLVFKSTASRIETVYRDFSNIKKYWLPALESGEMYGFVAYLNELPVASVICTLGGNKVTYTAGGIVKFEDENKNLRPAHLLQYLCMNKAFELGYKEYDLSSIVGGGVGLFKSSFKPFCFETCSNFVFINSKFKYNLINWVLKSRWVGKYKREIAFFIKKVKK